MTTLMGIWICCGLLSLVAYSIVSFRYDRRFVTSTWIKLWLTLMVLLGPLGTVLTAFVLMDIVNEVQRTRYQLLTTLSPQKEHIT